jgi:putative transposase
MDSGNYENKNFVHNAHSVGASEYHLQWVTKYRYDVLAGESSWKDCEMSIRNAAERHGIKIVELGVMEDHVHVVAEMPPNMSVAHAIGLLKGASSYEMFRKHPEVKKRYWGGHFWGRGYFYRSVSNVTDDVVRRYVRVDNTQRQRRLSGAN